MYRDSSVWCSRNVDVSFVFYFNFRDISLVCKCFYFYTFPIFCYTFNFSTNQHTLLIYKPAVLHVLRTLENIDHLHYTRTVRRTQKEQLQGLSCLLPALQTERRACPLHDKSRKGFLAQRSARTVLKGRATLWERAQTICSRPTLATGNHSPKVHLHPCFVVQPLLFVIQ